MRVQPAETAACVPRVPLGAGEVTARLGSPQPSGRAEGLTWVPPSPCAVSVSAESKHRVLGGIKGEIYHIFCGEGDL